MTRLGLFDEFRGLWNSRGWHETLWRAVRILLLTATIPFYFLVLFADWLAEGPDNHWRP